MEDKDNPGAQTIMNQPYPHSTDETPYYLSFRHPQNFYEIDYPAHWQVHTEEDGAVEFAAPTAENFAGLMLFELPYRSMQIKSYDWENGKSLRQSCSSRFSPLRLSRSNDHL